MSKMPLPIIIKDTREKLGWNFRKSKNCAGMIEEKLDFGDYAVQDYEDLIIIERKQSINELCNNFGKNRDRFEREMQRIADANVKFRYVIVEDHWSSMSKQKYGNWNEKIIMANIHAFELKYNIHFIMAGSPRMAQKLARSLLIRAYTYRYNEMV